MGVRFPGLICNDSPGSVYTVGLVVESVVVEVGGGQIMNNMLSSLDYILASITQF